MSALDTLLEEVRAEAKNAALAEYENRIDDLENQNRELLAEVGRFQVSNDRWEAAFQAQLKRNNDLVRAMEDVLNVYDGR